MNRPDRCLQDLRERIVPVPCAKQNAKASDNVPLIKLRIKRKKKFLSSLRTSSRIAKAASRKVFIKKESDFSAPKPDRVKNAKGDENHHGVEFLQEVSRIASARRAKAAARIKFIRNASPPTRQLDIKKGEEKKDDDHPGVEASNGTLKIRIQVKVIKLSLSSNLCVSSFLILSFFDFCLKDLHMYVSVHDYFLCNCLP